MEIKPSATAKINHGHFYGALIMLGKEAAKALIGWIPVNKRVITVLLN